MNNVQLKELLSRYVDGSLSAEELQQLMNCLRLQENHDELQQAIDRVLQEKPPSFQSDPKRADNVFWEILESAKNIEMKKTLFPLAGSGGMSSHKIFNVGRLLAAAVILTFFLFGGYYLVFYRSRPEQISSNTVALPPLKSDVAPGTNKATLTLADGSIITLDNTIKGTLAQQGNARVTQSGSGRLAYNVLDQNSKEPIYNTVTTPRGGQYQVFLTDGSIVWLNASSSLRFPTDFRGENPNVVLTGEAYFEIAKHKNTAFRVKVGDMNIEVLGTHFNVMAYNDEHSVKTTLLQGAVKVSRGTSSALLKPGQQAAMNKTTSAITVGEADVDEAVAWKNGLFQFNTDGIEATMRQLERWYDVEIDYQGKIPNWHFTGSISRNIPLSQVLKMLEVNDFRFRVNGKKIIVLQ